MKTLEKLRQYLANTSKEQFDNHWKAVESVGVSGVEMYDLELQPKPINKPSKFGSSVGASYGVEEVAYAHAA